jgi:hypothetical protein
MTLNQEPPVKPVGERRQSGADRRRSLRAELKVPVVVKWKATDGSSREEMTATEIVNAHGCMLSLKSVVPERLSVEVINRDTNEARKGHVAWCGAVSGGRNQVGIELDDPDPKFWGQRYSDFLLMESGRLA